MFADKNKARTLELIERVLNGHDLEALDEFTSNPAVVASATGLLRAFPDLEAEVRWIVADGDITVVFHDVHGTQQGPCSHSASTTMVRSWINGSGRTSWRCSLSSAGASRR